MRVVVNCSFSAAIRLSTPMPPTLLEDYPRKTGRFDEMLGDDDQPRPSWREFLNHLENAAPAWTRHQHDYVRQRIQENGVTYNAHADPQGNDRPWELDPLPMILPQDEWNAIAAAVTQRARLFDALLTDLYGEQRLLRDGGIPPALVYGHDGFLWPCQGIRPPGGIWLHLYAADLARSPDGRWWVIADRTQAPSGAGYALENRLIVSRLFPEKLRELGVLHLTPFFTALQENLAHWAPGDDNPANPRIVLLTSGHRSETYFEHAYLARHLGYPLVEGQDLTVRDKRVYLKTLTGLKRVHAILRRFDGDFYDPLELRGDSAPGIPGLLQAVRAGAVLVANAPGSGLLESAALPGFLPSACQTLLGEKLRMPSVATWWCGEQAALDFVVEHLDQLVIKSAFPSQGLEPVFGSELHGAAREAMIERLRACPNAYVAQELVRFSQSPSWSAPSECRLVPRGVAMRVFVVATPRGHQVMPGGLTRVVSATNAPFISMQRGGSSKDTWVPGNGPVDALVPMRPMIGKADLVRGGNNLSSRVVENLFWFGRYTERCQAMARLLRTAISRLVGAENEPALRSAHEIARDMKLLPEAAPGEPARHEIETQLLAATHNAGNDGLGGSIRHLLEIGAQMRERFSLDNWHALSHLQQQMRECQRTPPALGGALAFLDRIVLIASALAGFAMNGMTHDDGWRFLIVGRRIESLIFLASAASRFLRLESASDPACLECLLELSDSIVTYRSRYMVQPELLPAIDLVVFDETNPHAAIFQAHDMASCLDRLESGLGVLPDDEPRGIPERLRAFGQGHDFSFSIDSRLELAHLLDDTATRTAALSDRLAMRYFTHVDKVRRQTWAA
jgi:uncharacterized circularly permuted ATP-grasp superfamily protein/uncharacterized alpha-E superfamily protein